MRTLPLRLAPIEGESLPGSVARDSHTFQFPPGDVLRALGLDGGSGIALAAGRYGAWLSPRQIEHVAIATGIDPTTIGRMLLSRYAGRAFEQPAGALDPALAAAAHGHAILIRRSRFCPHCLHQHGAWLLSWPVVWSFACVAHRVLLLRRSTAHWGHRVRDHPADLATALPKALALADLPDPDTLGETLRQLADDRYHNDGLTLVVASNTGPMSEPLKAALRRAVTQAIWASASRQLGFHPGPHRRPDDLDPRLGPQHVPQLFWAEDYNREIADLLDFDDSTHWHGRRFCSVLLARMLSPLDWNAAARYLDLPDPFINNAYNATFAKLRSNDQFSELATRVKQIANRHAENDLIDDKQRRQHALLLGGGDRGKTSESRAG